MLELSSAPAGISDADWLSTPTGFREFVGQVQALQMENERLRHQFTALATELAGLRVRLERNSRNSSKPLSSGGQQKFLEIKGIEPTNNAAVDAVFSAGVRALRHSVI